MGRKGALVLLVVMALWAAMPALACVASTAHHACCHTMPQDCSPSPAMSGHACCVVHSSPGLILPGAVATPDHSLQLARAFTVLRFMPPQNTATAVTPARDDSPPSDVSAGTSILRI